MLEEIDFEREMTFGSVDYVVSLATIKVSTWDTNMKCVLDVEDKNTGDIWRGDY